MKLSFYYFEEFFFSGQKLSSVDDLLIGEVRIKPYSDRANRELGDRYGIKEEVMWPEIILFKNGDNGAFEERARFHSDAALTWEDVASFVRQQTGLVVPLDGSVPKLDALAAKFVDANDVEKEKMVKEAEVLVEDLPAKEKVWGERYVKLMRSAIGKDVKEVANAEKERIKKLLISKNAMSTAKREDLKATLNALRSFVDDDFVKTAEQLAEDRKKVKQPVMEPDMQDLKKKFKKEKAKIKDEL